MRVRSSGLRLFVPGTLVLLASVLYPDIARAHAAPSSVVFIDLTVEGARLEQDVPVSELEAAMHRTVDVDRDATVLLEYAGQHVSAAPWTVDVRAVERHASADGPRARFTIVLSPPPMGADLTLVLSDDLVTHEVVSHYTSVYVRSDWTAGDLGSEPHLVGVVHAGRIPVTISRSGSVWRGLRATMALGVEHIATGTDHLLFLLVLVLGAPRWRPVVRLITAFTIGHCATLALGAIGRVTLPTQLVETTIAATILLTAIHAARPIFPKREALLAGVFGLVHGLAFSATLADRHLGAAQTALTLFGFNTGIELAQLGILALVVPWILLLARTRFYPLFRVIGAALAGTLALGWLVERALGWRNPAAPTLTFATAHPLALLVALALVALAAWLTDGHIQSGKEDGNREAS